MAKKDWLSARLPEPYYLPTPSFGMNRALGGRGLSSGRIHLYWGPKAAGKSTLAMKQIALAQADGKQCAFIDSERAFTPGWAELNGVNIDDLWLEQANSAEKILTKLVPDMASSEIDVLIIDSMSSIAIDSYWDKDDSNAIGTFARSSKFFTSKLLNVLGPQQQIIFISHMAMAKEGSYFVARASVGSAIDHWSSTQFKIRKVGGEKGVREDGSSLIKWRLEKSKQSVYPVEGEYWFNSSTREIDSNAEIVSAAIGEKLITNSGAWFYYKKGTPDEIKWQGQAKIGREIAEDAGLRDEISSALLAKPLSAVEDEE